jgi:hypothetical protein
VARPARSMREGVSVGSIHIPYTLSLALTSVQLVAPTLVRLRDPRRGHGIVRSWLTSSNRRRVETSPHRARGGAAHIAIEERRGTLDQTRRARCTTVDLSHGVRDLLAPSLDLAVCERGVHRVGELVCGEGGKRQAAADPKLLDQRSVLRLHTRTPAHAHQHTHTHTHTGTRTHTRTRNGLSGRVRARVRV